MMMEGGVGMGSPGRHVCPVHWGKEWMTPDVFRPRGAMAQALVRVVCQELFEQVCCFDGDVGGYAEPRG